MTTSTAPISDTDIVGVIGDLQATGTTITAEAVYQEMRLRQMPCRRSTVQAVVRDWKAAQQTSPGAPSPVAPTPVEAPVRPALRPALPYLLFLRRQCAEDDEAWRDLEREQQQLAQDRAEHRSAYRGAVVALPQQTRSYLDMYHARHTPAARMDPNYPQQLAQKRAALVDLVGEEAVAQLEADRMHKAWWLEG